MLGDAKYTASGPPLSAPSKCSTAVHACINNNGRHLAHQRQVAAAGTSWRRWFRLWHNGNAATTAEDSGGLAVGETGYSTAIYLSQAVLSLLAVLAGAPIWRD